MRIGASWQMVVRVLLVLIVAGGTARLYGQARGSITGTIADPTGAAVPNATVVAHQVATGVETEIKSSETGTFLFPAVDIGAYTLRVSGQGFKTVERTGITVVTGETVTVNVPLELGAVTQTVEVTGTPTMVDFTRTTAGSTQISSTLESLPINQGGTTRHARDFLVTLPGVFGTSINDSTPIMGTGDAGPHRDPIMYRIDGQMAAINLSTALRDDAGPPPDLIQEFRLVANLDAEQGWTEGTGVELITKSGTNNFHGAVYEYVRNNKLDSRGFTARNVPIQKQNNFGAFIGGPIWKNKHFFMASYDGFVRRTAGSSQTQTVPTALMRGGDFTEFLGAQVGTDALGRPIYKGEIYDPTTTRSDGKGGFIRDPFTYQGRLNVIDPAKFSAASKFFQGLLPLPTRAGLTANWIGVSGRATDDIHRLYFKTDHNIGNHRVTFGYEVAPRYVNHTTSAPGWDQLQGTIFDSTPFRVRIQDTWTLKPNLLLTTRVGTNQVPRVWGNYSEPSGNVAKGVLKGAQTPEVPGVAIPEVSGFGGFIRTVRCPQGTYPASVDLAWVKGKHNLKFGGEYLYQYALQTLELFTSGNFGFSTRETNMPGLATTGVGYASYLLGAVDTDTQWTPRGERHTSHNLGFYAQDSWKATPKLTINYGLRWNIFVPFHESYGRIGAFSPTVVNPKAGGLLGGLTFWGTGPGRNGRSRVADMNFKEFCPRFGFAYQIDSKTVFRAYYGLDNYPLEAELANGFIVPDYGAGAQVNSFSPDNGLTPLLYWDNGVGLVPPVPSFDPGLLNGTSVAYLNPLQTQAGRVQNLGAALEREVGWGVLLRAEYVGKMVHGIPTNQLTQLNALPQQALALGNLLYADINSPAAKAAGIKLPYAGFTGPVYQALRPYPQFQFVSQVDSKNSYSLYHALFATVQKRFGSGLSMLVSYGVSKMLTPNDEGLNFNSFNPSGTIQAPWMGNTSKMLATYAPSQQFKATYSYDLPFGPKKRYLSNVNPVLGHIVGGWTVAGIQLYQNGTPITIGTELSNPGLGPVWATQVPGTPIRTSLGCGNIDINNPNQRTFLNINAFRSPAPFTFGNVRVLPSTRTCGFSNEDISVLKDFQIRESMKVTFGGDFFDIFNRHHWGGPATDINNLNSFGGIFGASGARNIQLHLKFEY